MFGEIQQKLGEKYKKKKKIKESKKNKGHAF